MWHLEIYWEKNGNSILSFLLVAESQVGKVFTTHGGIYFHADQQKKTYILEGTITFNLVQDKYNNR